MIRDVLVILSGFGVGLSSGALGVGGGILLVPIMTIGFGLPQHLAQGTSLAAIIPSAAVGAITHDRRGNVHRTAAAWMGAAGVLGVSAGALLALHLPHELLTRAFGAVLLAAAYSLWPRRSAAP